MRVVADVETPEAVKQGRGGTQCRRIRPATNGQDGDGNAQQDEANKDDRDREERM
jgi:hypothetical protein